MERESNIRCDTKEVIEGSKANMVETKSNLLQFTTEF